MTYKFKTKKYQAGLILSPFDKRSKMMWQLEKTRDNLSCDVYEFEEVEAKNKQEAVDKLNEKYKSKYGNKLRKKPFEWGEGWW